MSTNNNPTTANTTNTQIQQQQQQILATQQQIQRLQQEQTFLLKLMNKPPSTPSSIPLSHPLSIPLSHPQISSSIPLSHPQKSRPSYPSRENNSFGAGGATLGDLTSIIIMDSMLTTPYSYPTAEGLDGLWSSLGQSLRDAKNKSEERRRMYYNHRLNAKTNDVLQSLGPLSLNNNNSINPFGNRIEMLQFNLQSLPSSILMALTTKPTALFPLSFLTAFTSSTPKPTAPTTVALPSNKPNKL